MIYAGVARSKIESDQALALVAECFSLPGANSEAMVLRKGMFLRGHPGYKDDSTIVVCDENDAVIGCAFLIDCILPLGARKLQGIFISSVAVAAHARGKGHSHLLMDAVVEAGANRGADIAIVIARRAVDRYYNKFGFWGLAQYSKVNLNIETLPKSAQRLTVKLTPVAEQDFCACAASHAASYRDLAGHCHRGAAMWRYIVGKLPFLGLRLDIVRVDGVTAGYVIHDGRGNLHEVALMPDGRALNARLFLETCASETNCVTLHIPPAHPFIAKLEGGDVSLIVRECPYGGHMIRVLNASMIAEVRKGSVIEERTARSFLNLSETATLLRLSRLTDANQANALDIFGSFNIPLLDQI